MTRVVKGGQYGKVNTFLIYGLLVSDTGVSILYINYVFNISKK